MEYEHHSHEELLRFVQWDDGYHIDEVNKYALYDIPTSRVYEPMFDTNYEWAGLTSEPQYQSIDACMQMCNNHDNCFGFVSSADRCGRQPSIQQHPK